MVLTISSPVGDAGRGHSEFSSRALLAFSVGATITGAGIFGVFSVLGAAIFTDGSATGLARATLTIGVAILAAAYGVSYLSGRPLPLKHTYRQVPKLWREAFSREVAALLYGLGLGLGFFTKVPYVTFYVALVVSFLSANAGFGLAAGVIFGLARSLPLALFRLRGVPLGTGEGVTEGLGRLRPRIDAVNGFALFLVGVGLLFIAL